MGKWIFRCCFCLATLAASISLVYGGVQIAAQHRVENTDDGVCMWAALQTLGNHFGITALHGLAEKHKTIPGWHWVTGADGQQRREQTRNGDAFPEQVEEVLSNLGVRYESRDPRDIKDFSFIERMLKQGRPVIVGVKNWPNTVVWHAVLVMDISDGEIDFKDQAGRVVARDRALTILDSNNVSTTYPTAAGWFKPNWTGFAVALHLPNGGESSQAVRAESVRPAESKGASPFLRATFVQPPKTSAKSDPAAEVRKQLITGGMSESDADIAMKRLLGKPLAEKHR